MQKEKAEKRPLKKLWLTIAVVILLLLAVLLILYKNGVDLEDVKGAFAHTEQTEEYYYEYGSRFAEINHSLVVLSESKLQVLSSDGETVYSENLLAERPVLRACGRYAVAYDSGGTEAWVVYDKGFGYRTKTEDEILSASVNEHGWMAVCTKDSGYDSCVTVYDDTGEAVYQWFSGDGYSSDAQVSPDNRSLAVSAVSGSGSRVVFTDLDSTEETASAICPDTVPLEIRYLSDSTVGLVTDKGYTILSAGDGTEKSTYSFEGRYLQFCEFADSYTVLASSKYQLGLECTLTVIDRDGDILGEVTAENEIYALSTGGNTVAVLSTGKISVYNKDMSPLSEIEDIAAEDVAVLSDGTVLAIGTYSAVTYKA